jgi:hypothetical protein
MYRVSGLFANDELYRIEIERNRKALTAAKANHKRILPPWWKVRTFMINQIKRTMPKFVVSGLRKIDRIQRASDTNNHNKSEVKPFYGTAFSKKFNTNDLYYRRDNLDTALDLMAICSNLKK